MSITMAVLFDGGNTLLELDYKWLSGVAVGLGAKAAPADIAAAAAQVVRRNSRRYGRVPDASEADRVFLGSFQAVGEAVGLIPEAAAAFARMARAEDLSDPAGLWRCASPGAAPTLGCLRDAGLRLGVISNADGHVEKHLALAGLRGFLDVVIDSAKVGVEKPDARIFTLATEQLGVRPENALYVGDLWDIDVGGAEGAGLSALLYDPWDAYPDVTAGRIRSLGELIGLLRVSPHGETEASL